MFLFIFSISLYANDLSIKEQSWFQAAKTNDVQTLEKMIEEGFDIETRDSAGRTAAHHAAMRENIEALIALKRLGADLEARDTILQSTPGHYGAFSEKVLRTLKRLNVNLDLKNIDGEAPVHWTARIGTSEALQALEELKVDLEATDNAGRTVAHWTAIAGHPKILENLPINLNARDNSGMTPSHYAIIVGKLAALVDLKDLGADLTIKDNSGRTPLDIAKKLFKESELQDLKNNRDKDSCYQ